MIQKFLIKSTIYRKRWMGSKKQWIFNKRKLFMKEKQKPFRGIKKQPPTTITGKTATGFGPHTFSCFKLKFLCAESNLLQSPQTVYKSESWVIEKSKISLWIGEIMFNLNKETSA